MSNEQTTDTSYRAPRRGLRTLVALALVWIVLVAAAAFVTHRIGVRRVHAALERIRRSGDPVAPLDVKGESRDPAATLAWLERASRGALVEEQQHFVVGGVPWGLAPIMFTPSPSAARGASLADVKLLAECAGPLSAHSNDIDAFWRAADAALSSPPVVTAEYAECYRLAYEKRAAAHYRDALAAALEACSVQSLSARAAVDSMQPSDSPTALAEQWAHVTGSALLLRDVARARAWAGDSDGCLQALRASLCLARLGEDLPSLASFDAWSSTLTRALDSIDLCAPRLAAGADAGDLIRSLETIDAGARVRDALVRTRMLGLRAYELARDGRDCGDAEFDAQPEPLRWLSGVLLPLQQASYLDQFERAVAEFDAPLSPSTTRSWHGAFYYDAQRPLDARLLAERGGELACRAKELDARVRLTRLGLLARELDLAALHTATAAVIDPLSGDPLHVREDDRYWVLWSVGRDGVDQGGVSPSAACSEEAEPDFVVRVPRR